MNSFNHYSLGAVGAWLYEYVLGIARDEEAPGFSRFILKPCIQGLAYANGFYESIHGRIESGWERTEGKSDTSLGFRRARRQGSISRPGIL
ncbi:MAG: alpha-L-rhamnosidase C-terminal domain-containing protein [Clostridia bacterium]